MEKLSQAEGTAVLTELARPAPEKLTPTPSFLLAGQLPEDRDGGPGCPLVQGPQEKAWVIGRAGSPACPGPRTLYVARRAPWILPAESQHPGVLGAALRQEPRQPAPTWQKETLRPRLSGARREQTSAHVARPGGVEKPLGAQCGKQGFAGRTSQPSSQAPPRPEAVQTEGQTSAFRCASVFL